VSDYTRLAHVSDRMQLAAGWALAVFAVAALLIPLAVVFTPLVGHATGFYTMGITANESGLRFMGLAGMLGGAALVGSIWLLTTRHKKP